MAISKSDIVRKWWQDRVDAKSQVVSWDYIDPALVRPSSSSVRWKRRVSTDVLWEDFRKWVQANCRAILMDFTKIGFCTVMYQVTGASASKMRVDGVRKAAADFKPYYEHLEDLKQCA